MSYHKHCLEALVQIAGSILCEDFRCNVPSHAQPANQKEEAKEGSQNAHTEGITLFPGRSKKDQALSLSLHGICYCWDFFIWKLTQPLVTFASYDCEIWREPWRIEGPGGRHLKSHSHDCISAQIRDRFSP